MFEVKNREKAMRRAMIAAPLFAAMILASCAAGYIFSGLDARDSMINLALYVICTFAYLIFFIGFREALRPYDDPVLLKRIDHILLASIVFFALSVPLYIPIYDLGHLLLMATFVVLYVLVMSLTFGVLMLRTVDGMEKLAAQGSARGGNVAFWYKVSGWLSVTVIGVPIAAVTLLVASYHMWQFIGEEITKMQAKTS